MSITIVIVPGFNEPESDMNTLAKGRRGKPGLEARGYRCALFPRLEDTLSDRIDRYAEFIELQTAGGRGDKAVSLGYSLGGLVVRGFLRRYPERLDRIAATIQLGTPNWGVTTDMLPMLTAFLRLKDKGMGDLNVESDFMHWLNGTGGHWVGKGKDRNWELDSEPWIAPPGADLFSIYGVVPRFGGDNDGIVWKDSATLANRILASEIRDSRANHLNLIGAWNLGTLLIKAFLCDDRVWVRSIAAIAAHIGAP